jgi:hypothetical protein
MKALLYSAKRTKLFSLILLLGFFGYTHDEPLNFDYNTYLSQKNDTNALGLVSVSSFKVERNISLETITQIS